MKTVTVPSLGDPGSFDITDKNDPLYYIARFSHECSLAFYGLNQQGFAFTQPEYSDVESAETTLETFFSEFQTWYDNATSEGTRGVPAVSPPSLPSLADIISGIVGVSGGLPALLTTLVLRVGVNLLVDLIKNAIIPDTGDMEEVADKLEELKQAVEDLKYNDEEIDFGVFRANLRSKVIITGEP